MPFLRIQTTAISLSRKFHINGPQLIYFSQLEHKTEDFAKINPFQTVPVIEHNGHNIIESVAILRYLTSTHKVDDHWYPNEPLAQARVDEYLSWQHANTRSGLTLDCFLSVMALLVMAHLSLVSSPKDISTAPLANQR